MKMPISSVEEKLSECVEALVRSLPVEEIWLFGSQATGTAQEDSDIDLLVILPDHHGIERPNLAAIRAISRLRKGIRADVAVFRRAALRQGPLPLLAMEAFGNGRKISAGSGK